MNEKITELLNQNKQPLLEGDEEEGEEEAEEGVNYTNAHPFQTYPEEFAIQNELMNIRLASSRVGVERLYEMFKEITKHPLMQTPNLIKKQEQKAEVKKPNYLG